MRTPTFTSGASSRLFWSIHTFYGASVLCRILTLHAEQRPHSAVALQRGPLHYAYDIPRTEHVLAVDPHEHRAIDLQMEPAGEWAWAIDPTTAVFRNEGTGESLELYSIVIMAIRPARRSLAHQASP